MPLSTSMPAPPARPPAGRPFNAAASIRPRHDTRRRMIRTIVSVGPHVRVHRTVARALELVELVDGPAVERDVDRPRLRERLGIAEGERVGTVASSPAGRAACTTPALAVVVDGAALREGVAVAFDRDPVLHVICHTVSPTTVIPSPNIGRDRSARACSTPVSSEVARTHDAPPVRCSRTGCRRRSPGPA